MTGGWRTPSRPASGTDKYTIWAHHEKVGRWLPIRTGLAGPVAVTEVVRRQDVLRRRREPCRIIVLPDGEMPR